MEQSRKTFFSIIIPAYNVGDYIENTVNSILRQDDSDYQLILIDDGSTDHTADVCRKLAALHPETIEFLRCEHRGVSATRNEGLKRAAGQYVMFVDGDDFLKQGALKYLQAALSKDGPDLLCFGFERVRSSEEPSSEGVLSTEKTSPERVPEDCSAVSVQEAIARKLGEKTIPCVAACIKNSLIKKNGIQFDEDLSYAEDALFLFRCMLVSGSIRQDETVLYCYLQRPGSATHLAHVPSGVFQMELKAWRRIKALLSAEPVLKRMAGVRMRQTGRRYWKRKIKEILPFRG